MEIEVTSSRKTSLVTSLILLGILAVVVFGFAGYAVTPKSSHGSAILLTWDEWHLAKARFAYTNEKYSMQKDVQLLRSVLDGEADPVRTQILADRMLKNYQDGLITLSIERDILNRAIQAVRDWSIGTMTYEEADQAVQAGEAALDDMPEVQTPAQKIFLPRIAR